MAMALAPRVSRVERMLPTIKEKACSQLIGAKGWSIELRYWGVVRRLWWRVSPTVAPLTHTWPREEG